MVFVQSPISEDTAFSIFIDGFGNVLRDKYDYEVANNFTTYRRLEGELREIGSDLIRTKLNYKFENAIITFAEKKDFGFLSLKKDMSLNIYDPPLPLCASVYITDEDVSYGKMAEVIKAIERVVKAANIPVSGYSVRIEQATVEKVMLLPGIWIFMIFPQKSWIRKIYPRS